MEITKNHKRLQETTISQQNLESEIHEQMHRKSSKKKQKIWTQQLQALILKCDENFPVNKIKGRWCHREVLWTSQRTANTYTSESFQKF